MSLKGETLPKVWSWCALPEDDSSAEEDISAASDDGMEYWLSFCPMRFPDAKGSEPVECSPVLMLGWSRMRSLPGNWVAEEESTGPVLAGFLFRSRFLDVVPKKGVKHLCWGGRLGLMNSILRALSTEAVELETLETEAGKGSRDSSSGMWFPADCDASFEVIA